MSRDDSTPLARGRASDNARWARLIDENLPSRDLWPDYVYRLPDSSYPDNLNVAQELLAHADRDPDKCAIRFRGRSVTYDALRQRVQALAAQLATNGVQPMDRVGIRLPNGTDFIAGWLAVQWLGAICVPIPQQYRRRELIYVLSHSGTSALMCDAEGVNDLTALTGNDGPRVNTLVLGATRWDARGTVPDPDPYPSRRDQPAIITYVAGTDGTMKGVVHSPAEILAAADTYARTVLRLTSADVCVGTTSLGFAYGLGALLTFPLRAGATTVLPDGPLELLQAIGDERATILFSVPTMYRMLLQHPDLDRQRTTSLRCCVSAAEPLPAELVEQWRSRTGLDIVDGFGTTELTHIFISARPGDVRPGLVGTVVDGYDARIVDAEMQDMADGTSGLLAVRGPTGARYWRNPEAQRRTVRDGWTLTGDICVRHADGWFQHLGRADALVVSAGYKIAVLEVERVLQEHPEVASARVFSTPDPVRGAVTSAIVVPASGVDGVGLTERLQRYLKAELAPFKCPREIQIA